MTHTARRRLGSALAMIWVVASVSAQEPAPVMPLELQVEPREATVGDRLRSTLSFELPAGSRFDAPVLGPQIGPFTLLDGSWSGPEVSETGERWNWNGSLAAYRTGTLEIPAIEIRFQGPQGTNQLARSAAVPIEILSVLTDDSSTAEAELDDLKGPASLDPDLRMVLYAAVALLLLLLGLGLLWWLKRRFADRFSAVPPPPDPFLRMAPHVWAYERLRELLERPLLKPDEILLFTDDLSRILKQYLGGRYRTELMEQTTSEVPDRLRQAGAAQTPLAEITRLLGACDQAKFAGALPSAADCRKSIDAAFIVVDSTKPDDEARPPAEAGAA